MMTQTLLWLLIVSSAVLVVVVWRGAARQGETLRKLDRLSGDLARAMARIESFEKQVNEYWRGVEMRIGKIHDTFESGRACRMSTTIVDVDMKMGHLNRKMDDLTARLPRPGEEEGEP
ncbi:MAG TPA: hypothetical protein VH988_27035 [Thermoanaerobaculia bacterium]|jgi:hypothetical protein|nr:hypothetical protein [Thermoanaerobaculia bacterium]